MPSRSELRYAALELLQHFQTSLPEATTSSVTTVSTQIKSVQGGAENGSLSTAIGRSTTAPGDTPLLQPSPYVEVGHQQVSPSTATSKRSGTPEAFAGSSRNMQAGSRKELDDALRNIYNNMEGGQVETPKPSMESPAQLPEDNEGFSVSSTSGGMEKLDESPKNKQLDKVDEDKVTRAEESALLEVPVSVRRSARLKKQTPTEKTNVEKQTSAVRRRRGRPKKVVSEPEKSPLNEIRTEASPTSKRKSPEVEKPMTEEEKEELMWERLARLESRQEANAKKTKKKSVKETPRKGGEDSDLEAHFAFPADLDELESEEDAELIVDQQEDELRQIWRDADFAIRNSIDNLMEQARRITAMQTDECDCDHEFAFREDIGKVCLDCGYVDKLVTQHFELARSFKRPRTNNNKPQLEKDCSLRKIECREDTLDEVEDFNPSDFHLKYMRQHQKEGFRFLAKSLFGKEAGGVFLHHAPGTGKTFLVVSFLQAYFYKFPERRALVAVPKNMLEPWEREFKKWQVDPIPVKVLFGDDKLSIVSKWYDGTGVLLVTPHMLALLLDERKNDPSIQEIRQMLIEGSHLLVVDEAHVARTRTAKIFSSLRNIKTRQRIFLSGTAFQNNLDEVFHLLELCRPNFIDWSPEYGLTPDKGHKQFFKESVQDRLASDRPGAIRAFRSLTEPIVQWYGGKVLEDLPGLEDFIVTLKLSDTHMMKVKQYVSLGGKNFMAEDHKLAQACVHPCLADEKQLTVGQDPYAGIKTAFIIELLRFVGKSERVIIFCQFRKPLSLLKQLLKDEFNWSLDTEVLHIDGDTPGNERMIIMDLFNSAKSKARVLLASLKTCGEGISLVGGSRVVVLDIAWNPSVVRQAVSRAFRIGQTKKVFVYRLLATGTEEVDKLRSSLDKEFLGRALFDTGFNIDGNCMPVVELTPGAELGDKFLTKFLQNNREKCVVKTMKW